MELNKEDIDEMYSSDDQGEYMPESGMQKFSVWGLSDALTYLESEATVVQLAAEEYALLLEVTMADRPGHLHPPAFSWNAGMVLHILKGDPALRDLQHVQVDSPGITYLFFYDKQGHRGLKQDAAETLREHVAEAFSLSGFLALLILSSSSSHWQRVGGGPQLLQIGIAKGPEQSILTALCPTWFLVSRTPHCCWWGVPHPVLHGWDKLRKGVPAPPGHPPHGQEGDPARHTPQWMAQGISSSPNRGGADSDGYSMVSKAQSTHCCRRKRWGEKCWAPAHLDMLIFKSTDPNADVTYTLRRFNVQGRLDQYQEESMMPHIYNSLRGYPGRWVQSLEGGPNLTVTELLEHMDRTFGDMQEYDTMICSLYEIRQKEAESVEEYML